MNDSLCIVTISCNGFGRRCHTKKRSFKLPIYLCDVFGSACLRYSFRGSRDAFEACEAGPKRCLSVHHLRSTLSFPNRHNGV